MVGNPGGVIRHTAIWLAPAMARGVYGCDPSRGRFPEAWGLRHQAIVRDPGAGGLGPLIALMGAARLFDLDESGKDRDGETSLLWKVGGKCSTIPPSPPKLGSQV